MQPYRRVLRFAFTKKSLRAYSLKNKKERKKVTKTKSFKRLLIATINIDIQRDYYDNTLNIIEELKDIFNELLNLNINDQLLHVRILVASTRIYHHHSQFHRAF